ncbi:hypothetical protein [Kushneria konosiri]|uniref:Uncharacterized protein n=1 Tax=Kushneria konosiri TaxID=698828 RepID=A0A2Z2H5L1_9GAMM|nr:hypothetical protein [Kushneria konosiri]ARS52604.1 hypothetical protein B9G99_06690 [Kushneria konosiri]
MKFESYWLDTAPPFTGAMSEPPEGHYDVAVIDGVRWLCWRPGRFALVSPQLGPWATAWMK